MNFFTPARSLKKNAIYQSNRRNQFELKQLAKFQKLDNADLQGSIKIEVIRLNSSMLFIFSTLKSFKQRVPSIFVQKHLFRMILFSPTVGSQYKKKHESEKTHPDG